MSKPMAESTIDIALWFMEQATQDDVHLQPMRLQRLLFLAQLLFAERHQGARLMPACFVLRDDMPVEVNVFRVFETGHPLLGRSKVAGHIANFLDEVWQQRTMVSMRGIEQALLSNPAYLRIVKLGEGAEVSFQDLREIAALELQSNAVEQVMSKNKADKEVLSDGRVIKPWMPRTVSADKVYNIETIKRK